MHCTEFIKFQEDPIRLSEILVNSIRVYHSLHSFNHIDVFEILDMELVHSVTDCFIRCAYFCCWMSSLIPLVSKYMFKVSSVELIIRTSHWCLCPEIIVENTCLHLLQWKWNNHSLHVRCSIFPQNYYKWVGLTIWYILEKPFLIIIISFGSINW